MSSPLVGVLAVLVKDRDDVWKIREIVAGNRKPQRIFLLCLVEMIMKMSSWLPTRLSIILETAHHPRYHQRLGVVDNPSLPYDNLLLMLGDSSEKVRKGLKKCCVTAMDLLGLIKNTRRIADGKNFSVKTLMHTQSLSAQEDKFSAFAMSHSDNGSQAFSFLDVKALKQAKDEVLKMDADQRMDAAENKDSSVEMLAVLAEDNDWRVREEVALNTSTPDEMLAVLAEDGNWAVREGVASNTNASKELLTVLGNNGVYVVRTSVAQNENTPVEALIALAEDDHSWVREAVASNMNTPSEVLIALAGDNYSLVREGVAQNPSTDPGVLVSLSHEKDYNISRSAQINPSLPLNRILELTRSSDEDERSAVILNPSLPYEYFLLLAGDESEKVRRGAEYGLR